VTIEQALELGLDRQIARAPDCVAMEARLANTEAWGRSAWRSSSAGRCGMNASRVMSAMVAGRRGHADAECHEPGTVRAPWRRSTPMIRLGPSGAWPPTPSKLPSASPRGDQPPHSRAIHLVVNLDTAVCSPTASDPPVLRSGRERALSAVTPHRSVREVRRSRRPTVIANESGGQGPTAACVRRHRCATPRRHCWRPNGYETVKRASIGVW